MTKLDVFNVRTPRNSLSTSCTPVVPGRLVASFLSLLLFWNSSGAAAAAEKASIKAAPEEMRAAVSRQQTSRTAQIKEVVKLLSRPELERHVESLGGLECVEVALHKLDDETLQYLASESGKVNQNFSAGIGTTHWVIIGLIAFLSLVLVWNLIADPS